jgi:hypothetical protein
VGASAAARKEQALNAADAKHIEEAFRTKPLPIARRFDRIRGKSRLAMIELLKKSKRLRGAFPATRVKDPDRAVGMR